jgi:RNA polymerase sigma factor (sigma-70 family)
LPLNPLNMLEAHGVELHQLLIRLTLRPDVADDLLQELFLRLRETREVEGVEHPLAFARRVAIHLAFDWRRAIARQQRIREASTTAPQVQDPPWLAIAQQEEAERILRLAAELSPIVQQAFVLRYVAGERFAQVGAAVGRTPHQARALCHLAIREIRQRLPEQAGSERKASEKAGVR